MSHKLPDALQQLIEKASEEVREGQVVDAILAGGTATWLHLQRTDRQLSEQARYSEDADIQFNRSLVLPDDLVVSYRDEQGQERYLALDRTYTIDIGLRHPDYLDNAEFLFASRNGRIRLYLLGAMDLAVTKVGRFEDHDRQDIELLTRAGLIDAEAFRQKATEALDYLATNPAMIKIHIDEAVELIRDAGG